MKMQTHMMTTTGFASFQRANEDFQQLNGEPEQNSHPKEHYIGLSGGGWRAMTSHMGSFRSLSNKGVLEKVKIWAEENRI